MITPTGNNLNIVIKAEYDHFNEWSSYACWYSINRLFPDANVSISIPKPTECSVSLFRWVARAGIKRNSSPKNPLVVPSDVMAVRELPDLKELNMDELCSPCDSDHYTTFVKINKCCKYNKEEWIKKTKQPPFSQAKNLFTIGATINEKLVLDLWNQLYNSYTIMAQ